jgi:3-methyladenine DNA glycosylase AlkD
VWSRQLEAERGTAVLGVVRALGASASWIDRVLAFELLAAHRRAFALLNDVRITYLSKDLADWGSVDLFGVTIAGPAWRERLLSGDRVHAWARSSNRWRRRLALVATVPLNSRARGGAGDSRRTLAVCRMLVADRDDMVEKALSWALRELSKRDARAVRAFVDRYDENLPARVKREVRNKLRTGRKNP